MARSSREHHGTLWLELTTAGQMSKKRTMPNTDCEVRGCSSLSRFECDIIVEGGPLGFPNIFSDFFPEARAPTGKSRSEEGQQASSLTAHPRIPYFTPPYAIHKACAFGVSSPFQKITGRKRSTHTISQLFLHWTSLKLFGLSIFTKFIVYGCCHSPPCGSKFQATIT